MSRIAFSLALALAVGGLGGLLLTTLGLPGGWITGAIAATFLAGAAKLPVAVPGIMRSVTMGFAGMTVGAAIDSSLLQSATVLVWSLLAMFALVALLSWLTYLLHARVWHATHATALSCAWPGNVLLVFAGAEALQADMQRVTVVQLVRVVILMGILPLVIGGTAGAESRVEPPLDWDFAIGAAVALLCTAVAVRIRIAGAEMFLTAIVIGSLSAGGLLELHMPSVLLVGLQVMVGVYIGLALARCSRRAFVAALAPSLAGALLAAALTLTAGFLLSDVLGYPAAALALAYAPGGAEVMILLAASFDADPGFVGIHHTLRLIVLTFSFPILLRRFA